MYVHSFGNGITVAMVAMVTVILVMPLMVILVLVVTPQAGVGTSKQCWCLSEGYGTINTAISCLILVALVAMLTIPRRMHSYLRCLHLLLTHRCLRNIQLDTRHLNNDIFPEY